MVHRRRADQHRATTLWCRSRGKDGDLNRCKGEAVHAGARCPWLPTMILLLAVYTTMVRGPSRSGGGRFAAALDLVGAPLMELFTSVTRPGWRALMELPALCAKLLWTSAGDGWTAVRCMTAHRVETQLMYWLPQARCHDGHLRRDATCVMQCQRTKRSCVASCSQASHSAAWSARATDSVSGGASGGLEHGS